jgi:predicted transglutaminase-like cysteine proteinase
MARYGWSILIWILAMTSIANAGPRLVASSSASPLAAWVTFCDRHPEECRIDLSQPEALRLTESLRTLLDAVNTHVNRSMYPMTDEMHWGAVDVWSFPEDGMGDCEDYQLLKRRFLIEAGLPRRALLMTVVLDELGQGHAVLTVRTDRGDFILDNKTNEIKEWFETGYMFVKREGSTNREWVFLAPELERDPTVVAAR